MRPVEVLIQGAFLVGEMGTVLLLWMVFYCDERGLIYEQQEHR